MIHFLWQGLDIALMLALVLATAIGPAALVWAGSQAEPDVTPQASTAWTVMSQLNSPPLLMGLTPQFAKILDTNGLADPAWRDIEGGASLELILETEGDLDGDIVVGLFRTATWNSKPVAVRRVSGSGRHTMTGLPAGAYQISAMCGTPPVPKALGVHRQWPEPVTLESGCTTTANVLVSETFQKNSTFLYNERMATDLLGQWPDMNPAYLLKGRFTGPDGRPVPFGQVLIREYNPGASSISMANRGTNEQGFFRYDGMDWPYRIYAVQYEILPSVFGSRMQQIFFNQVLEGAQTVDFQFEPFPKGQAGVTGRVVDQNGRPVQGFFIRVRSRIDRRDQIWETPDGQRYTTFSYTIPFISEDGVFEVKGLPEGTVNVNPIPFEIGRYETEWGKDVDLKNYEMTEVALELKSKQVFYGRVLFEDGRPAIVRPAPWDGATTRISLTEGRGRSRGIGKVQPDGTFTVYLEEREVQILESGSASLRVTLPDFRDHHLMTAGEYPFDQLSRDRATAGEVRVPRPASPVYLPPDMRQGRPLPRVWTLDFQEHTRRLRESDAAILRIVPIRPDEHTESFSHLLNIYTLEGQPVESLPVRDRRLTMILQHSGNYLLTLVPQTQDKAVDLDPTSGPFLLDLSRPGQYTLILVQPATAISDQVRCMGTVVDAQGDPIAGATVTVFDLVSIFAGNIALGDCRLQEITGTDGRFTIKVPSSKDTPRFMFGLAVAYKDGLALGWTEWDMRDDLTPTLRLWQPKGVQGLILDEQGTPVSGARVRANLIGSEHNSGWLPGIIKPDWLETRTGDQGTFRFDHLPAKTSIDFLISAEGFGTTFTDRSLGDAEVDYQTGDTDIRITLPREGHIRGKLLDPDTQEGLSGHRIGLSPTYSTAFYYRVSCVTDPQGLFTLDRLRAGTYWIMGQGLPGTQVTVTSGDTTDVRIQGNRLYYGGVLFENGRSVVIKPEPWPGAVTRIGYTDDSDNRGVPIETLKDDGTFSLYLSQAQYDHIQAGTARLYITVPTGKEQSFYRQDILCVDLLARDPSRAGVAHVRMPADLYFPLKGSPLPSMQDFGFDGKDYSLDEKPVLICFFDMEQRPSRNCLLRLSRRAQELEAKSVVVVPVQASKTDEKTLNEWVKRNRIAFPIGMVQGDAEKIRLSWGVRSLPWLILTDQEHIVHAEGFALSELSKKLKLMDSE